MIKSINVKIGNNQYLVKRNFKSLLLFEEMTGKNVFKMNDNLSDSLRVYYCMLKANNDFNYSFDEFLDFIEDDDKLLLQFTDYLTSLVNDEVDKIDKKKPIKPTK